MRPVSRSADSHYLSRIISDLVGHSLSWAFLEPVKTEDVPDYYDVIKNPMGTLGRLSRSLPFSDHSQISRQCGISSTRISTRLSKHSLQTHNSYSIIVGSTIQKTPFIPETQPSWRHTSKICYRSSGQVESVFGLYVAQSRLKFEGPRFCSSLIHIGRIRMAEVRNE